MVQLFIYNPMNIILNTQRKFMQNNLPKSCTVKFIGITSPLSLKKRNYLSSIINCDLRNSLIVFVIP